MRKIAVTGGIACGKSTVGMIMANKRIAVLDTDDVVHELIAKDTSIYREIVLNFGKCILDQDGEIDRRLLGDIVFSDRESLTKLNRITHPAVELYWQQWLAAMDNQESGSLSAAVIIPLLYEGGFDRGWNSTICVASSKKIQLERMAERSIKNAIARIDSQMALKDKMRNSEFVIFNSGTREFLEEQVDRILKKIMEK